MNLNFGQLEPKSNGQISHFSGYDVCGYINTVAYVVSMLIAWRIRKISAYALVNE